MKKAILSFFFLVGVCVFANAQTAPAVTLTYLESSEILDSCTGCTNPYQSRFFTGVKVAVGSRVTYIDAPYSIRRYGTSRLKFELKSGLNDNSVRFNYSQVNSTTYPSATRLYDDLRVHQAVSPGLYTTVTATGTVTLTNAHADNLISLGSTQANYTLNLPANPVDGQVCIISFHTAVTTLTISGNGETIVGTAAVTAAAGTMLEYRFYGGIDRWLRQQ